MTTVPIEAAPGDEAGKRIGMWFFLFTEFLFFGGVFLLYAIYRYRFPSEFHIGAADEKLVLGSINTAILLTSSLFMALAVAELRRDRIRRSIAFQWATILFGAVFLAVKGYEWGSKIAAGIYPNAPTLLTLPDGRILFFGLYYTMTGIHALHVAVGMGLIAFMIRGARRGLIDAGHRARLENTGLFWHFVDIVWIYLFPLFYLIT